MYIIENNEMRAEPENSQIENLIEEDFINMDAYISLKEKKQWGMFFNKKEWN